MRRPLPLHGLAVFEAAAQHLSFTRAARALNVQQPAVSRQVATLETELGLALFRRRKPDLELTEAGRRLLAAVTEGFDRVGATLEGLRREAGRRALVVNASIGLASCWLLPRLAGFRRLHPGIEVTLVTRDRDPDFRLQEADIVIRFGEGDWPGAVATRLFDEVVFPVCSPGYLGGRSPALTPAELARERLLHFDDGYYRWQDWRSLLAAEGATLGAQGLAPIYNSFIVLVQAVLAGEGIALGWGGLLDDYLARGALLRVGTIERRSSRGYFALLRDAAMATPQADAFLAWLVDCSRGTAAPATALEQK